MVVDFKKSNALASDEHASVTEAIQSKINLLDIKTLIQNILSCNSAGAAKPLIDQLVAALCAVVELDLHPADFTDNDATITALGKAVSPTTAAQCAEDVERTRVFLQGVHQCLVERVAKNPGEPLHVLYAGTGPFGLLLVPLLPLFNAQQLRVTLLDIHQDSLNKLQRVIDHLQVNDFIHEMHCADACTWVTSNRFDMIISETMKHGLIQEPQVSVFAHVQKFLAPEGVLIPEQIILSLWLARMGQADDVAEGVYVGNVFQLDKTTSAQIGRGNVSSLFGHFSIPEYSAVLTDLKLTTTVRVYDQSILSENQSQLTLPIYEKNARPVPGSTLSFHYELNRYPKFVFEYQQLPSMADLPLPDILYKSSLAGVFHLPRLWHKAQLQKIRQQQSKVQADEWLLDRQVLDMLGVGLEPALQKMFLTSSADEFEAWVISENNGVIAPDVINAVNNSVANFVRKNQSTNTTPSDALSSEQRRFWSEHGYIVIPGVLSADECANARAAVWQYLGMSEEDSTTWYETAAMQKIMVQLFRHPALDVARNKPFIREIFNALWQRDDLVVSTDRVSFNPPETDTWKFPGPDLHWDVELQAPIPFGTQGLIYLTDTEAHQGAFSCVPGFQHRIDEWLGTLPPGRDPGEQDWSTWSVKPIAAKAGDLIIWHQALPHGSSANGAQRPRIVQYINMYAR